MLDRLEAGGGPFVVIAHSQGSMIAYDVLRRLDEADSRCRCSSHRLAARAAGGAGRLPAVDRQDAAVPALRRALGERGRPARSGGVGHRHLRTTSRARSRRTESAGFGLNPRLAPPSRIPAPAICRTRIGARGRARGGRHRIPAGASHRSRSPRTWRGTREWPPRDSATRS